LVTPLRDATDTKISSYAANAEEHTRIHSTISTACKVTDTKVEVITVPHPVSSVSPKVTIKWQKDIH
jgi:hypothetical protein